VLEHVHSGTPFCSDVTGAGDPAAIPASVGPSLRSIKARSRAPSWCRLGCEAGQFVGTFEVICMRSLGEPDTEPKSLSWKSGSSALCAVPKGKSSEPPEFLELAVHVPLVTCNKQVLDVGLCRTYLL
jgi:hypothetical protein